LSAIQGEIIDMPRPSASTTYSGADFDADAASRASGDEARAEANERRVRRGFWPTMKRAAGYLPFAEELVAAYYCALDSRTPMRVRAMLLGALAYFVLPIDVVPDLLVGVGFTDDVTVILGVLGLVRAHITEDHRVAAREALGREA
jgi:uncharacterized membrane protein YkvA (DUF1232 family)